MLKKAVFSVSERVIERATKLKTQKWVMGGESKYEIAQNAYIKLVLHALKHKSSAVNAVLLGRVSPQNDVVEITDSVPLFHTHLGLLPQLEISLILVTLSLSLSLSLYDFVFHYELLDLNIHGIVFESTCVARWIELFKLKSEIQNLALRFSKLRFISY